MKILVLVLRCVCGRVGSEAMLGIIGSYFRALAFWWRRRRREGRSVEGMVDCTARSMLRSSLQLVSRAEGESCGGQGEGRGDGRRGEGVRRNKMECVVKPKLECYRYYITITS